MSNQGLNEKFFSLGEIEDKALKEKKILVVLFEGVYDLTRFAEDHPGGDQILKEFAGKNATQKFVQTGHLTKGSIISTMAKFRIGKFIQAQHLGKL